MYPTTNLFNDHTDSKIYYPEVGQNKNGKSHYMEIFLTFLKKKWL